LNGKLKEDEQYKAEDLESKKTALCKLARGAAGELCPMAAIFGGIIAQEVIKATSLRFSPLNQFFFLDNTEVRSFSIFYSHT